ncbi:MAG: hypothetical protein AAB215_03335 [Planctomycetota bacterium]
MPAVRRGLFAAVALLAVFLANAWIVLDGGSSGLARIPGLARAANLLLLLLLPVSAYRYSPLPDWKGRLAWAFFVLFLFASLISVT